MYRNIVIAASIYSIMATGLSTVQAFSFESCELPSPAPSGCNQVNGGCGDKVNPGGCYWAFDSYCGQGGVITKVTVRTGGICRSKVWGYECTFSAPVTTMSATITGLCH